MVSMNIVVNSSHRDSIKFYGGCGLSKYNPLVKIGKMLCS